MENNHREKCKDICEHFMFVLKTSGFCGMVNCPFFKFNFASSYISYINNINPLRQAKFPSVDHLFHTIKTQQLLTAMLTLSLEKSDIGKALS